MAISHATSQLRGGGDNHGNPGERILSRIQEVILACLAFGIVLSGCAQSKVEPVLPTSYSADFPPLNTEVTKDVGEAIVEQSLVSYLDGFEISADYEYRRSGHFRTRIAQGSEFLPTTINGVLVYCGPGKLDTTLFQEGIWAPWTVCMDASGATLKDIAGTRSFDTPIPRSSFIPKRIVQKTKENFQQKLIYTGKSGNSVFISYREFKDDFARPAFTQDVTFDLREGNVVGFQGARFEILKATNTQITYKMLANFKGR